MSTEKNLRFSTYDYSQNGYYFVTINIHNSRRLFGEIVNAEMVYSKLGLAARNCWMDIPKHFPFVLLDVFQIMPSHIHGIICIDKDELVVTQDLASQIGDFKNEFGPQKRNLSSIIRGYKIGVSKFAKNNQIRFAWRSRFNDRIVRDEAELNRIRDYILNNPAKWQEEKINGNNATQNLASPQKTNPENWE